ncbi:MAG: Gfo/Idh/MocA family oxidoreductase [Isosphaeraceae bacterium]|nr:Gfo/Idh/MocA family oxidoreductase [Isosphaeraceae bacterium]
MSRLNRRQFLTGSAAAGIAAGFAIGGTKSSGRVLGANDSIRIGVAGLNGRGASHVGEWTQIKGVEITYLIDPDTRTYGRHLKTIETAGGSTPQTVLDVRKALDDKNLDAVSVATPNHWHSLITVWACQAGKDVYVEKPCSHNVHEGRVAVEAARKYDRIVQHGTQSRSMPEWANIADLVKSGRYGKLLVSRALCYKPRGSIGVKPTAAAPEQVDFNLWLGPAPEQPYHANLVPYNWHWFWDFGNGDIGNQGVHQMDVARWMVPGATFPKSVLSLGGRFGYEDQGQTPNTQLAVLDYGDTQIIFEVRGLKTEKYLGQGVGNILHLEEGTIAGNMFYPKGAKEGEPLPKAAGAAARGPSAPGGKDPHFGNFVAAVRSRKPADLNADILEGHYSSALCHLANLSYRLGEPVPFNKQTKAFGDDKDAYETLARMEEHLARGNGLKLDGLSYQLGRKLTVDASTETTDSADANKLLTREYRKPFVVPDKIG